MISGRLFIFALIMVAAGWVYGQDPEFTVEFLKQVLMNNPGLNCTSEEAASEAAEECFNSLETESDQVEMQKCLQRYCAPN